MQSPGKKHPDAEELIQQWEQRVPFWRLWLGRAGLQGKLIVGFVLLLFLALGASSWLFVYRSRGTLSDIMGEQATQLSISLALASKLPLSQGETTELDRMGRDLLKSRNIVFVAFFDPSGNSLAIACRDPDFKIKELRSLPNFQSNTQQLMQVQRQSTHVLGDYLQVVAPVLGVAQDKNAIEMHPRLLGYVAVGVSQTREQAQLNQVSYMGLTLGCLIFMASLPIAAGIVHRILLPIRELVVATNAISAGNYDSKVAAHRPDEIGTLARSFNEMARRVKQQQEELKVANRDLADANRDLEQKVSQRTHELEASNKQLSLEMAEKEDFLRAVSHDLNAPLRNIGGMAAMLLVKYRERFDDDIIHRLERIQKNVEVETDLISELLELSRIKTRRQRIEDVDVQGLVHDLGGVFEEDLRSRGITLVNDAGPEGLPPLSCERARVRQVFQNLIDNAIKYMGDGATREIHVGGRLINEQAEFYVRDTGIGIEPEDLNKVFFVFRRGKNSAACNVAGKGVGLASVKTIVEMYGGRIEVESQLGKGSTFRFSIGKKFVPALGGAGPEKRMDPPMAA